MNEILKDMLGKVQKVRELMLQSRSLHQSGTTHTEREMLLTQAVALTISLEEDLTLCVLDEPAK